MIEPNRNLKYVDRSNFDGDNRSNFLRLDKNEFAGILPGDIYGGALRKINQSKITMYPEYGNLKKKIAKHTNTKTENVILGNGSDAIIKNIFDTYININCDVLLTDPTFAMYPVYCNIFGAGYVPQVKYNSLTKFPTEEFIKKIKENEVYKMAVIINPNNPTGCAISKDDIHKILNVASDNNVLVVVDEAYHYYYKETMAKFVNTYNNLIVLRTFSKFFGLAGLRIGFGLAHPEIVKNINKVQHSYPIDCVAVAFAEEILDHPELEEKLYNKFIEGKNYIINNLEAEGITYHVGESNFVLIKCKQDVVEKLRQLRILVKGNIFDEYIRVTIGDKQTMETFWCNFLKVVKYCD